eukprot:TRINITY_DN40260_c1_g1_i2.p1 TRINITY_DN40260_c1_g1~~TRINITY_DN40260_c1_g1_i2.p1  ORF type:complete len:313 (-),score=64.20 TRINITY_DN40260_c1_g1_i2:364-1302(-)
MINSVNCRRPVLAFQQRQQQHRSFSQFQCRLGRRRKYQAVRISCQYDAKEYSEAADLQKLSEEVVEKLGGTSIYLVGMMGCGKSTVGRYMAHMMQYYFFDTDALIEKAANQTVAEIFEQEGEEEFRKVETQTLQQLAPFTRCLVSTGGGAVIKTENWAHMQHGIVIWVSGPPQILAARLAKEQQKNSTETRPLLQDAEGEQSALENKLIQLIEERKGKYQQADIQVSIVGSGGDVMGSASIEEVCRRILLSVKQKIDEQQQIMEEKKKFVIERSGDIPVTMAVTEGPYVSQQQQQQGAQNEYKEDQNGQIIQ